MASELEELKKILSQKGKEKYAEQVNDLISKQATGYLGWGGATWGNYPQEMNDSQKPQEVDPTKKQIMDLLHATSEAEIPAKWTAFVSRLEGAGLVNPTLASEIKTNWSAAAQKLGYTGDAYTSMLAYIKAESPKLEQAGYTSTSGGHIKVEPPVVKSPAPASASMAELRKLLGLPAAGGWNQEFATNWGSFIDSLVPDFLSPDLASLAKSSWVKASQELGFGPGTAASALAFVKAYQEKVSSGKPAASAPAPEAGMTSEKLTEMGWAPKAEEVATETPAVNVLEYITNAVKLMAGATGDKLRFNTPFRSEKRQVTRWVKRFFGGDLNAAAKAAYDVGGEDKWLPLVQEDISLQSSKDQKGRTLRSGAFFGALYQTLRSGAKEMRQEQRQTRRSTQKAKPKPTPKRTPPKLAPRRRRASERLDKLETLHKEASKKK